MPYDYSRLLGRITERFGTQRRFAAEMEMSDHSMSKKLSGKMPWKQREIATACSLLGIRTDEIGIYFFTLRVQTA